MLILTYNYRSLLDQKKNKCSYILCSKNIYKNLCFLGFSIHMLYLFVYKVTFLSLPVVVLHMLNSLRVYSIIIKTECFADI